MTGKRNLYILFFTMVVVMLGFGMIIPIMPFYIQSFGASGNELGMLMATFATMQFIFAPVWGSLSDHYGRKPVLMLGVLGNAIAQLLIGLSTEMWMLFASRALSGILSSATLPTAMAYIGDSTSDKDRGGGMGMVGAAMGVGMVLGPGIGGALASRSLALPFFVASGLSVLALAFVFVVVPESLPKSARIQGGRAARGPQLAAMGRALAGPAGFLFFLAFLLAFGLANFEAVFGLWGAERHGFRPQQVGMALTVVGLLSAVVQGAGTGPLTRRWGEVGVIRASLLLSAVGFVLMLQARTFAGVLLTVGLFVISNTMLTPSVSALISKRASTGQGMAMGLTNAFMSLGRILGPTWAGFAFDLDTSYPYLTGSVLMLVGFLASLVWLARAALPHGEPATPT